MVAEAMNQSLFKCPICRSEVSRDNDAFPFCSERCRTIDLGCWAAGDYRFAGEAVELPDQSSEYSSEDSPVRP